MEIGVAILVHLCLYCICYCQLHMIELTLVLVKCSVLIITIMRGTAVAQFAESSPVSGTTVVQPLSAFTDSFLRLIAL